MLQSRVELTDALRRISFACRSSRFSFSSCFSRALSSVVGPGRKPWLRSACLTQIRSVSGWQPIFAATAPIAAHCDEYSDWCSSTIRTARSRTSGAYLANLFMLQSSQGSEPPRKSGRFTSGEILLIPGR